jgi:hypothetical protein
MWRGLTSPSCSARLINPTGTVLTYSSSVVQKFPDKDLYYIVARLYTAKVLNTYGRELAEHNFCLGWLEHVWYSSGLVWWITYPATVHWGLLSATRLASRKVLYEQNIKKLTGPALCVLFGIQHRNIQHRAALPIMILQINTVSLPYFLLSYNLK